MKQVHASCLCKFMMFLQQCYCIAFYIDLEEVDEHWSRGDDDSINVTCVTSKQASKEASKEGRK